MATFNTLHLLWLPLPTHNINNFHLMDLFHSISASADGPLSFHQHFHFMPDNFGTCYSRQLGKSHQCQTTLASDTQYPTTWVYLINARQLWQLTL
jgi:hypothetical protein